MLCQSVYLKNDDKGSSSRVKFIVEFKGMGLNDFDNIKCNSHGRIKQCLLHIKIIICSVSLLLL